MRYLPHSDTDRRDMLAKIGVKSIDDLFCDVPEKVRLDGLIDLPLHAGELEVDRHFTALGAENMQAGSVPFFVGCGAYRHHVPASVDHLIQRGEFLTSYTPYQPEISQGTLQVLFEFQSQVAALTGMEVANASMYDGSTGCAEAILMARRVTRRKKALISGGLHAHYVAVSQTETKFTDDELVCLDPNPMSPGDDLSALISAIDKETSSVVVQNPDMFGHVQDLRPLADAVHEAGALLIVVVTEIMSLGVIMSPGEMGADIVVGEGQSIGNGLNFGGPYLGLFACKQKYIRQMPGRLCGETTDATGKRGYVLTLSTREQHIRREKATSNICTNAGLCSLAFSIHMSLLGEAGLRRVAKINHQKAVTLKAQLAGLTGVKVLNDAFFNEITLDLMRPAAGVVEALAAKNVLAGVPASRLCPDHPGLENLLILAATETVTDKDISALVDGLKGELS